MTCVHCNEPAFVRCRKHRQSLCGETFCTSLHRMGGGNCEFVETKRKWEGMDWVVAIGSAIVVAVGIAIITVHL